MTLITGTHEAGLFFLGRLSLDILHLGENARRAAEEAGAPVLRFEMLNGRALRLATARVEIVLSVPRYLEPGELPETFAEAAAQCEAMVHLRLGSLAALETPASAAEIDRLGYALATSLGQETGADFLHVAAADPASETAQLSGPQRAPVRVRRTVPLRARLHGFDCATNDAPDVEAEALPGSAPPLSDSAAPRPRTPRARPAARPQAQRPTSAEAAAQRAALQAALGAAGAPRTRTVAPAPAIIEDAPEKLSRDQTHALLGQTLQLGARERNCAAQDNQPTCMIARSAVWLFTFAVGVLVLPLGALLAMFHLRDGDNYRLRPVTLLMASLATWVTGVAATALPLF